ncbi:MAG: lycopene cyclase domain-containing protein [Bacteroidia bacterium]|nr:lycopene cyclase domain-containing protein [Bacteroidia bacterium]
MWTYLLVNLASLAGPFALSFDRRVRYVQYWPALLPAILLTGLVFIPWDAAFTAMGVWGFTPAYVMGIYPAGLPVEEWMFFVTIPYACLFVYECVNAYLRRDLAPRLAQGIASGLGFILLLLALLLRDRWYPAVTCTLAGLLLIANGLWIKPVWLGRFLVAYLICLIPFLIVNGVLTALPVVWYNDAENTGLRIGTIPAEDTMYGLLLILMNIQWYEWLKRRMRLKPYAPAPAAQPATAAHA